MFERFTQSAREAVVLAQEEARKLRHNHVGTEHLLLGIAREGGAGAELLARHGVQFEDVRSRVVPADGPQPSGQIAFAPRARNALELAMRASLDLGDSHIGSDHLLLGVVADPASNAARLLDDLGVSTGAIRASVAAERRVSPRHTVTAWPGGWAESSHELDYDEAVGLLRAWEGRDVTAVIWPSAAEIERPYRGRLAFDADRSDSNRATFTIPTDPPDDRLGNPDGVTFAVHRDGFGGGRWVGGPEPGVGISVVQGATRVAVFRG